MQLQIDEIDDEAHSLCVYVPNTTPEVDIASVIIKRYCQPYLHSVPDIKKRSHLSILTYAVESCHAVRLGVRSIRFMFEEL
jgi:hypothetical protein